MSCSNPFYIPSITNYFGEIIPLPCGCCLSCKIDRRSLWEMRLKSEWQKYQRCAFVRLSYDDFHLPYGKDGLYPSLNRSDVHKFLDNIRNKLKYYDFKGMLNNPDVRKGVRPDFKYFVVGEYGEDKGRPHYHVIFFGLDFQQAKKLIQTTWKKGFTDVRPLKSGGIRYVLKYIDKGLAAGRSRVMLYDRFCIERPKIMASKGIGVDYFLSQLDVLGHTGCVKVGARYVNVPVYYRNKYLDYTAEGIHEYLTFQVNRRKNVIQDAISAGYSDYRDYLDYLRVSREKSLYARARRENQVIERDSEFIDFKSLVRRRKLAYFQKSFNDLYFLRHPEKYMTENLLRLKKYGL